ncbi:MAG: hemolysin III family protein [SAR324 cluster bacterium]|uniref:Hemolysin III family protein n=1 Tax=SAR324 cluster bacterium TaxID=2024889 RepID=A0A7X9FSG2_9DELT|nr:hemolysin III family protein [SAR324 cluster bacterium]
MKEKRRASYSISEEVANSIIHGAGTLLSVAGLVIMIIFASRSDSAWPLVSCIIFGVSLIFLYSTSTLYHAIQNKSAKEILRVIDHCAIFILIAGSYTPFMLVSLQGAWGWWLFSIIWALAILGIAIQIKSLERWFFVSLALYVCMGWAALIAIKPLIEVVSVPGLYLLLTGGLAYTGGIVFYLWHKLPYHHAYWHGFVLAGSVCHFLAVFYYVIPGIK